MLLVSPTSGTTPAPGAVEGAADSSSVSGDLVAITVLAVLLVAGFLLVYLWPRKNQDGTTARPGITPTFAKVYGLLVVATFAVTLAFASVESDGRTAAYTVLGAIAGYLAATKTETTTTTTALTDQAPAIEVVRESGL